MKSKENIKKKDVKKYMEESHNLIDLSTLSRTLVGLSNQALSFRRDTVRKEYLNKFYEELLMPLE